MVNVTKISEYVQVICLYVLKIYYELMGIVYEEEEELDEPDEYEQEESDNMNEVLKLVPNYFKQTL